MPMYVGNDLAVEFVPKTDLERALFELLQRSDGKTKRAIALEALEISRVHGFAQGKPGRRVRVDLSNTVRSINLIVPNGADVADHVQVEFRKPASHLPACGGSNE